MKVVLIRGDAPVPGALRQLIAQGSTALVERQAGASGADDRDADRIVLWAGRGDSTVTALAERLGQAIDRRADTLVFVAEAGGPGPRGLSAHERFEWPADEDRLRMAFVTGA
jgi:hypothetical protein